MATQVTVNGVPVEQLIKQQVAEEITEVRQSENKIKPYRPVSKRIYRSNGVPVRKWNLPDYLNWAREPLIIVAGQVYPRVLKGDFAPSGESIIGALELNRAADKIKCHECGEFRAAITGRHLQSHNLTAGEYKERHGLRRKAALCAPQISQQRAAAATQQLNRGSNPPRAAKGRSVKSAETLNNREHCRVQLPAKLATLASELGRTPTVKEFYGRYDNSRKAIEDLFGSYNALVKQAGLAPNRIYSREELLERIRKFVNVCHRAPSAADFGKLLPAWPTYRREFGSWQNAVGMCM